MRVTPQQQLQPGTEVIVVNAFAGLELERVIGPAVRFTNSEAPFMHFWYRRTAVLGRNRRFSSLAFHGRREME